MHPSQINPPVSPSRPESSREEDRYLMRTHKIALRPTRRQRLILKQHADYDRFACNWILRYFKDRFDAGEDYPTSMLFPVWESAKASVCPWGKKLSQSAAKYAVYALREAIEAYKDKRRDNQFPRFHSRYDKIAFRADQGPETVMCDGKMLHLPVIGTLCMRQSVRLQGSIREVTVKREAGRWFAFVTVCMKAPKPSTGTEIVGIDVGVEMLATCSDGTTHDNPRARLRHWPEIQRCKEELAGKVRGKARRARLRRKLAKLYYRVNCLRGDAHHKRATKIVANRRVVVMETLGLVDMLKDKRGAGALSDAALRSFQDKIIYRCTAKRVEVIKVDRWFPSTQLCSDCGKLQKMSLGKRVYKCACGLELGRDFNAALNLERYGEERI